MSNNARIACAIVGGCVIILSAVFLFRSKAGALHSDSKADTVKAPDVLTHRVAEHRWIVAKRDRQEYLSDLTKATSHITLLPVSGEEKDSVLHLVIRDIDRESPMHVAGLRKGDLILTVNGTPIGSMGRAVNLVHEVRACDRLTVQVQRGDQIIDYQFDFD